MSWLAIIGASLKLFLEFFTTFRARDERRRKERKEIEAEAKNAIATRNAADINRAFNKLRNL